MTIFNNSPNPTYYGITDGTSSDCGNIAPNQSVDRPYYDNKPQVTVKIVAVGKASPNEYPPFSVTIPETGTGTAVTIGLYQE
jgi:hypothetical protein